MPHPPSAGRRWLLLNSAWAFAFLMAVDAGTQSLQAQPPGYLGLPMPIDPGFSLREPEDGVLELEDGVVEDGIVEGGAVIVEGLPPSVWDEEGEVILEFEEGYELPDLLDPRELRTIDGCPGGECLDAEGFSTCRRYRVYRAAEGVFSYMPGNGEQFGWIDFEDSPYISRNKKSGWATGINLHLLSGPISAPLPPRLWDFMLGYQRRDTFEDRFSYDMAFNVGVYSDFEDSARDGVRYVGHAVGMAHASDALDWVLGVDYLDRDDYRILPVCGLSLHPDSLPRWQFDAIFPRPRAQYALNGAQRLYVSGNLGGGTWDIEMPGEVNEVMTYRDFRLLFGHERLTDRGTLSAFELGYVFGRKLELREAANSFDFDDAFVLRFVTRR